MSDDRREMESDNENPFGLPDLKPKHDGVVGAEPPSRSDSDPDHTLRLTSRGERSRRRPRQSKRRIRAGTRTPTPVVIAVAVFVLLVVLGAFTQGCWREGEPASRPAETGAPG